MTRTLREVLAAKAEKEKALGALASVVAAREDPRYSDDERAARTRLRAELLDCEALVDDLELGERRERQAASDRIDTAVGRTAHGGAAVVRSLAQIEQLFAYEPNADARAELRRSPRTNPLATVVDCGGGVQFRGLGDYLGALYASAMAGSRKGGEFRPDPRLELLGATGAGGEGVPSEGAALAQLYFAGSLLERSWGGGDILSACAEQGVGDGFDGVVLYKVDEASRQRGRRFGGIQVFWRDSVKGRTTATRPRLEKQETRVKPLSGFMRIPEETLRDSTAIGEFALRAFPEEFVYEQEDAVIRGDGNGMPLGILNAPCLITVSKKSGQAAKTYVAENAIAQENAFLPRRTDKAGYYVNRGLLPHLRKMYLPTGTNSGQLVYMPANGISGPGYGTLGGYGVRVVEQASRVGAPGDSILADFSEYLLVRKRSGIAFASSAHIYFDTFEMCFRWEVWCNGQPIVSSPITPAQGNDGETYSPFVVVEERA